MEASHKRKEKAKVKRPREEGKKSVSRRDFLKGVAAGAVAAGITAVGFKDVVGTPAVAEAAPTAIPVQECDVAVGGAGMAGFNAALAAAQAGARVILVEASKKTGGTALFSGGLIHFSGAMTFEQLKAKTPLVDPELGRVAMSRWPEFVEFVRSTGLSDQVGRVQIPGRPITMDNAVGMVPTPDGERRFFDRCEALFRQWGGTLMLETKVIKLLVDEAGNVAGFRVKNKDGYKDIKAKAVVLATGSFANNKELVARYLGPYADLAAARCIPYNTGDALIMGQAVGAKLSRSFSTFYGHLQPYPILAPQTPEDYEKRDPGEVYRLMSCVQDYAPLGIVVNLNGERFIDESLGDEQINMATVHQPEARVFVIIDKRIYDQSAADWIKLILSRGGVVEQGQTMEELADKLQKLGVRRDNFLATVQEFNQAVADGKTPLLRIPKKSKASALSTPPFYAVPATAGISNPYGGLAINAKAQVLGPGNEPIPGLFAAPAAAGGVYYRDYGGALALCAVLGRLAGQSAAEAAKM